MGETISMRDYNIDEKKVKSIRKKVYSREVLNYLREDKNKYKDKEMQSIIKRLIEEQVDKCY